MLSGEIKAIAIIIRKRCCRAIDGRDISESESLEIAREALQAAERVRIRESK